MRFLRNRTIGHGARLKPLYNRLCTFHLFNGNASIFIILKIHKAAEIYGLPLFIQSMTVLFENIVVSCSRCLLKQMNGAGIVQMLLLPCPFLMASYTFQSQIHIQSQGIKSRGMKCVHITGNILQRNTSYPADRISKILVNHLF